MRKWLFGGLAVAISRLLGFPSGGELMKRTLLSLRVAVSLFLVSGFFAFVPLSGAAESSSQIGSDRVVPPR